MHQKARMEQQLHVAIAAAADWSFTHMQHSEPASGVGALEGSIG